MKASEITLTDQFCGAGGSSEGVKQYAQKSKLNNGIQVKIALNHWKLAIETHNTNHPNTDHDCTDISACNPRRYPSTTGLITSPECTNQTLGNGKKKPKHLDLFATEDPAEARSRATMWDVPRFAEYHKYEFIIVENVVEARAWIMWEAWLMAMHSMGYKHKCVYMNSMHAHPTPQSRDRMYIVFWKKGNKAPDLELTPRAYCQWCCTDINAVQSWKNSSKQWGKYKQQYIYRCPQCTKPVEPYYYSAFNCIDWSLPGTLIGGRKKQLSDNTMKRIQYGIDKYWTQPTIITTRYTSGIGCRVRNAMDEVMPTQPGDMSHAILNPFIASTAYPPLISSKEYDPHNQRIRNAVEEPGYTQSTHQNVGVVLPFIIKNYGGPPQRPMSMVEPTGTITTQDHHGIVTPMIVEHNNNGQARPINDRLSTILAGGNHHGLISREQYASFLSYYYTGSDMASDMSEPVRTISTNDRAALITGGKPQIEECYYRMLVADEVKLGMAFPKSYIILGSGKHQVKQAGNAVTPPAMEWLIERAVETLL